MIEQKYDYKFFAENYWNYDRMFRNYYKQQEKKFRYFIVVNRDINTYTDSKVYRSNDSIEGVLMELKCMEFQTTTIIDTQAEFSQAKKYIYNKFEKNEWICEEYYLRDRLVGRKNATTGKWVFKMWFSKDQLSTILIDDDYIHVTYGNIEVNKYKDSDVTFRQYTLVDSPKKKVNSDVLDKVRNVIKKVKKDNLNGFYDDVIKKINYEFGLEV